MPVDSRIFPTESPMVDKAWLLQSLLISPFSNIRCPMNDSVARVKQNGPLLCSAVVVWSLAFCFTHATLAAERPNVVLLVTDDQRPDTIHALGNNVIQTPHLDKLVREGTAFSPRDLCEPHLHPQPGGNPHRLQQLHQRCD